MNIPGDPSSAAFFTALTILNRNSSLKIKNVGLNSIPIVYVEELLNDGTLILKHEHDGRDLELAEANRVFDHINTLWSGDVKFTTIIEDEVWEF